MPTPLELGSKLALDKLFPVATEEGIRGTPEPEVLARQAARLSKVRIPPQLLQPIRERKTTTVVPPRGEGISRVRLPPQLLQRISPIEEKPPIEDKPLVGITTSAQLQQLEGIGAVPIGEPTPRKLSETQAKGIYNRRMQDIFNKYPKAPYTKEQMTEPWYQERLTEQKQAWDEYQSALPGFEQSIYAKVSNFLNIPFEIVGAQTRNIAIGTGDVGQAQVEQLIAEGRIKPLTPFEELPFWEQFLWETPAFLDLYKTGAELLTRGVVKLSLNAGLDKWIATQSRLAPEVRSALYPLVTGGNKASWVEAATNNYLARIGRVKNGTQAIREAVEATEQLLIPQATQTGAWEMGGLAADWNTMAIPERVALAKSAGLAGSVASKMWEALQATEITKLLMVAPKVPVVLPKVTPVTPEVTIKPINKKVADLIKGRQGIEVTIKDDYPIQGLYKGDKAIAYPTGKEVMGVKTYDILSPKGTLTVNQPEVLFTPEAVTPTAPPTEVTPPIVPPTAPPQGVVPEIPPEQELLKFIKDHEALSKQVKSVQHEALKVKAKAVAEAMEQGKGHVSFTEAMASLRGKLPTVEGGIPELQYVMSPDKINALYNKIGMSTEVPPFTRTNAAIALTKIIYGEDAKKMFPSIKNARLVPGDIKALRTIFGKEFADTVAKNVPAITRMMKLNDYFFKLYYNSLLSGPKTWVVNMGTGILNTMLSPVERLGAVGVEIPTAFLQNRQSQRFIGEIPADIMGAFMGIPQGVRSFLNVFKTGKPLEAGKFEMAIEPAFPIKMLDKIIGVPSSIMEASDSLLYQVMYRQALNGNAYRMARTEGGSPLKIMKRFGELMENPSEELVGEAHDIAMDKLFRRPAGTATQAIMSVRGKFKIYGFEPLKAVIPFIRTPINILKYGLERTPLGIANPKLLKNLMLKTPQASDQIGRVVIGSLIATAVAIMFAEGKITGSPPEGEGEKDRFYREGKQPWSIKVGDTWVSYQRLEPYNMLFTGVAAVNDAVREQGKGEKEIQEIATDAVLSVARNVISQTYMSGWADVLNAIDDPKRYGGNFLNRFVAGMVPFSGALRTITQATDVTIRQPKNIPESIKAIIPGLSTQVPARLSALGEEAQRYTPWWSPITISPERESALEDELNRLEVDIGFTGATISGILLNRDEQGQYQKQAGDLTKRNISTLIDTEEYRKMSDEAKIGAIDKMVSSARDEARGMMFSLMAQGDLSDRPIEEQRKIKDMVVTYEYYEVTKDYTDTQRNAYRAKNPAIDVALNIWGYVTTVKSSKARDLLKAKADEYGIPYDTLPALTKKATTGGRTKIKLTPYP